jgi:hypothetical protein
MIGKSDINSHESEEFFSIYPVDTYRRLYNNNVYYFLKFYYILLQIQNDHNTLTIVPCLWQIADKIYWHSTLSHQHIMLQMHLQSKGSNLCNVTLKVSV